MENSHALTTVDDAAAVAETLEKSRMLATANLMFAQEEIGRRILEPTLTTKTLLELAEHSYKVSGMAARNEPKSTGPGFSITIKLPGTATSEPTVIELSQEADRIIDLPQTPAYLLADSTGNLTNE
jgi:hypothetical protein